MNNVIAWTTIGCFLLGFWSLLAGFAMRAARDRVITNTSYGDTVKVVTGSKDQYYDLCDHLVKWSNIWYGTAVVSFAVIGIISQYVV